MLLVWEVTYPSNHPSNQPATVSIIISTHSTLCHSSSKFWLLSNIQQTCIFGVHVLNGVYSNYLTRTYTYRYLGLLTATWDYLLLPGDYLLLLGTSYRYPGISCNS